MENYRYLVLAELSSEGEQGINVEIMRTGSYHSERYGDVNITPEMLREIVNNFRNRKTGLEVYLKEEHDDPNPASKGWLKSLWTESVPEDGMRLVGKLVPNSLGWKLIEDKQYKYLSAEIAQLEDGSWALFAVALTNNPVVKNMETITYSDTETRKRLEETKKAKLLSEITRKIALRRLQQGKRVFPPVINEDIKRVIEAEGEMVKLSENREFSSLKDAFLDILERIRQMGVIDLSEKTRLVENKPSQRFEFFNPAPEREVNEEREEIWERAKLLSEREGLPFPDAVKQVLETKEGR
ncbi:hypothetical protein J7K18_03505 [bacterium]|nr:hypothetical protein [bacterium]